MIALHLGLGDAFVVTAINKAKTEHRNVSSLLQRSNRVSTLAININSISDVDLFTDFRFKLREIKLITDHLSWSGATNRNHYVCEPMLATCILLFRLAGTTRLRENELKFGKFISQQSEIFWELIELFIEKFGRLLDLNGNFLAERSHMYSNALVEAGSMLPDCVGFLDCTKIQMKRPGGGQIFQRSCFSGHKRFHCLIYQTLSTPDGLVFSLFGSLAGRRHDLTVLRSSGWEQILENSLLIDDRQFYLYGDSAYMLRPYIMRPFIGEELSEDQVQSNGQMSSLRESVEHNYKDIKQQWVSQDFPRNLKVRQSPISLLYKASAVLWNFRVCAYKCGQVHLKFNVEPPTLNTYIQL